MKRVALTTKTKLDLISQIEEGRCKKDVAADFGVAYSTACNLLKKKPKLLELEKSGRDVKRVQKLRFEQVDKAVAAWYQHMRETTAVIRGSKIRAKAREFAAEFGNVGFTASSGWLNRFKERYKNCGVTCHKRDTPSGQYDANGSDSYEGATSFNFEMPSAAGPSESTMDEVIEITPPVDIMPERIAAFDSTIGAFKSESEDTKSLSPEQLQRYVLLEQLRMFERQNCLIAKQQALCEIQLKKESMHNVLAENNTLKQSLHRLTLENSSLVNEVEHLQTELANLTNGQVGLSAAPHEINNGMPYMKEELYDDPLGSVCYE